MKMQAVDRQAVYGRYTGSITCSAGKHWNLWIGGVSHCPPPSPASPSSHHGLWADSRASTTVHHHGRNLAVDDLLFAVKVEHVDRRHLGGGTAGPCGPSWVGLVHQVGMWVLLQVQVLTLPRAVVGFVALRGNNPIPAKAFKVNSEWITAAARLWRVFITVQARVSPDSLGAL